MTDKSPAPDTTGQTLERRGYPPGIGQLGTAALLLLASCTSKSDVTQLQHACPAGRVPRIVDLKQDAKGIPVARVTELCPKWIRRGDDGLIENFEDEDSQIAKQDGRVGYWWFHTDPNGSTLEPGSFMPEKGGANGAGHSMHIWGTTATAEGAYGSSMGFTLGRDGTYDASKYIGIRFKARAKEGTSRGIRFKIADVNTHQDAGVCTDCWNHFGTDVTLTNDWEEYVVLFDDMFQEAGWGSPRPSGLTVDKLWGVDITIKPGRTFDFWVDDFEFISCQ